MHLAADTSPLTNCSQVQVVASSQLRAPRRTPIIHVTCTRARAHTPHTHVHTPADLKPANVMLKSEPTSPIGAVAKVSSSQRHVGCCYLNHVVRWLCAPSIMPRGSFPTYPPDLPHLPPAAQLADFGLSTLMAPGATHVSNFKSGTPFYAGGWAATLRLCMSVHCKQQPHRHRTFSAVG